jgi:hypothetical protein
MAKPRKKPCSYSIRLGELIEAAVKGGSVKLNLFVQDQDWIAIEGDRASLEFLGNLLLVFARDEGPSSLNLDTELPVFKVGSEGVILIRAP